MTMTILHAPKLIAAIGALLSLTGCNEHVIYHSYRHVPGSGWSRRTHSHSTSTRCGQRLRISSNWDCAQPIHIRTPLSGWQWNGSFPTRHPTPRYGEMPVDGSCHPPHGQRHLYVPIRRTGSSHGVTPWTNRTSPHHTSHATGSPSGHTRCGSPHQPLKP